jgi:hypothetical protein
MRDSIFIHGITQRSGTNFLNQLILLHPKCKQPDTKIRENWFLYHGEPLFNYINTLEKQWNHRTWQGDDFEIMGLKSKVGNAFVEFLASDIKNQNDYLVSKTPKVKNISFFYELFPLGKLLIIVRDPKDVIASTYKSWGVQPASVIKEWNNAAITIQNFEKTTTEKNYMLIRYEDLISDTKTNIIKLLEFCNLDKDEYPWEKVKSLPIFGSSEGDEWKVLEKKPDFKPIGRWQSMPKKQLKTLKLHFDKNLAHYFGYKGLEEGCNKFPSKEERINYSYKSYENKLSLKERFFLITKGAKIILRAFK